MFLADAAIQLTEATEAVSTNGGNLTISLPWWGWIIVVFIAIEIFGD